MSLFFPGVFTFLLRLKWYLVKKIRSMWFSWSWRGPNIQLQEVALFKGLRSCRSCSSLWSYMVSVSGILWWLVLTILNVHSLATGTYCVCVRRMFSLAPVSSILSSVITCLFDYFYVCSKHPFSPDLITVLSTMSLWVCNILIFMI